MGIMHTLDRTGDTETRWNPDDAEQVAAAKAIFDELLAKGYSAIPVNEGGEPSSRLDKFDPTIEKMIVIPALQGG